jgi:hypothetical protein
VAPTAGRGDPLSDKTDLSDVLRRSDGSATLASLRASAPVVPRDNGRLVKPRLPEPTPLPPFADEAARSEWSRPLPAPLRTGIAELDARMGGLRPASVYVVNAPTGKGKTGLAIQVSRAIARSRTVVYATSELSRRQILARVAAQLVPGPWLRLYEMGPAEADTIAGSLGGLRLRVLELGPTTSLTDVLARVADADGEPPVLTLDYLQHAARRLNPEDRRIATGALSDQLASWARDVNSTALIVSAVARGFYANNENKTATDYLGAAKETGDIDYDAAALLFLDVDAAEDGAAAPARLHVPKHRFGPSGFTIGLRFDGKVGMFAPDDSASLTEEQQEALDVIRRGAETTDEVRKRMGIRKEEACAIVRVLIARELVSRSPLRVRGSAR